MPNFLDYLIPQTMGHVRRAEMQDQQIQDAERKRALESVMAYMQQPKMFEGLPEQRVPPPEVLAAYAKGTGTSWPTAQMEQTGAPPPGVQEPVPGLASNMPQETLAVMRTPQSQLTAEMSQKAVAEALAKIKGQETTLANQGDLPAREFQATAAQIPGKIETLGGILKPYGYDPTDVAAQVVGKYPGAREAELKKMSHYPPRDTAPKLFATSEGLLPYDQAIGKPKAPTGAGAALDPRVKWAHDFIKRMTPVVTGQVSPLQMWAMGNIPEIAGNPAAQKALQGGQLPPELKAMYDEAVKIVSQAMGVQQAPMTPPEQATTSNDPLGIR